MPDKKNFPENKADMNTIIDWINELEIQPIRKYISEGISEDSRIEIIEKITGETSQPLRWVDLPTFKEEAKTNSLYARAESKPGFSSDLINLQDQMNNLLEGAGQDKEIILTMNLLVLMKSPECFIELTTGQLADFNDRLETVITESINSRMQEIQEATTDDLDPNENDSGQQENESPDDTANNEGDSNDELANIQQPEIEWNQEIIDGLNKISLHMKEDIQSVIFRLINEEAERVREEISYFLDEGEKDTLLPILYRIDIRTFSQLEAFDTSLAGKMGLISEDEIAGINKLKNRFGK